MLRFLNEGQLNKLKRTVNGNSALYKLHDIGLKGFFNTSSLKRFNNKYNGERVFIVGNGPSLNKHDLRLLEGEYSFAVNGIFYKTRENGYKPTFYVVEDRHVMKDNIDEINKFDVPYKFFPVDYKHMIKKADNTFFFSMDKGYYHKTSPNFALPRFSPDANNILYCGQSVTMINIQLAAYMGFSEIYLIGMDHNYVLPSDAEVNGEEITSNSDDPNHFHPEYFGKGKIWHDPHLDRVERSYQYMKLALESKGIKIFNATVGGKLEVFERKNYEGLFKQ
ncbi:motility associated factor glycosyltransferase family protein [Vibrio mediterranei]|uniref:motility associated factor glycosyltransferase family protein n=1 Tax=Vibrio mediterranei TaxID=689 RepID=UPI0040679E46